jgi:hypothetical protein
MYILITSLYLWCDIALWCTFSSHLFTFDVILLCDVHSHHISLPLMWYCSVQYHIKGKEMWWECTSQSNITSRVKRCDENVHHRAISHQRHSHHISLPLMWYCSVMYILVTSLYLWCDIALWCTFSSHLFTFDVILLCDVHSHHISLPLNENVHHRAISHQR